jgi:hypothetical protein
MGCIGTERWSGKYIVIMLTRTANGVRSWNYSAKVVFAVIRIVGPKKEEEEEEE